ncbi:MAG: DUF3048 domain-containing protein [Candidatus Moranbacteria bacterium]|nr:DUF3048 domain-containing protein [Candidatus Moranbacteria bacterium]
MQGRQKVVIALAAMTIAGIVVYFSYGRDAIRRAQVERLTIENDSVPAKTSSNPMNSGPVSAFSGIACEHWSRRPVAVMQPADLSARPAAGFSQADMVFEMPVITATINRLMTVYQCALPTEAGAVRSSRHDFLHLAKSIGAIYVHWGGSHFALDRIKEGILDNIDCTGAAGNSAGGDVCYRAEQANGMKYEDTSRVNVEKAFDRAKELGYGLENSFSGYPHRAETDAADRPSSGHLRIGYPGKGEVEYSYDRDMNAWKRTWGNIPDTDRNDGSRIAPKNVVALFVESEQIEGQYNNLNFGDPWYDQAVSGDAFYFIEGKQTKGSWKKDKSDLGSKLLLLDQGGSEVAFVPGQIWVNVVEPGTAFEWTPMN